jgi:IS605 OrfB family transposase
VNWAVERRAGTLAVGDVRAAADKVNIGRTTNQKISNWTHGRMRQYLTYKAEAAGMRVELVDEAYTSQTCPHCGRRHKPRGRVYTCPACGFVGHRDIVGSANLLSRSRFGKVGQIIPPAVVKYRHPFDATGKRSPVDTGQVAWVFMTQEAAPFRGCSVSLEGLLETQAHRAHSPGTASRFHLQCSSLLLESRLPARLIILVKIYIMECITRA